MTRRWTAVLWAMVVGVPSMGMAADASQLHSVMVKPQTATEPSGAAMPTEIAPNAPLERDWSSTAIQPPRQLDEMPDAKPLQANPLQAAHTDAVAASNGQLDAAPDAETNGSQFQLALPSPPVQTGSTSDIVQAQFTTQELPAPDERPASPPAARSAEPSDSNSNNPPATTSTVVDSSAKAAARAAGDLLAQSLKVGEQDAHFNRPIRLQEVVAQYIDRGLADWQQSVRDYWSLSYAVGNYRWCADELKRLEQVVPSRNPVDAPLLATARASASAELGRAEIALAEAQQRLAQSARVGAGAAGSSQPAADLLPADSPLVGPYITYFDQLVASRSQANAFGAVELDPRLAIAKRVDHNLPIRLKMVNDLAAAVQSAASAVHYAEEAHARGEVDMQTVLACHESLHERRRAFLAEVKTYNDEIAEYVAAIASPATSSDRLVAMLIRVDPSKRMDQASRVSAAPRTSLAPPPAARALPPNGAASAVRSPSPPVTSSPPTVASSNAAPPNARWMPSTRRSAEPIDPSPPADATPPHYDFNHNAPPAGDLPPANATAPDNTAPSNTVPSNTVPYSPPYGSAPPRYQMDQFQSDPQGGAESNVPGPQETPDAAASETTPSGETSDSPADPSDQPASSMPASSMPATNTPAAEPAVVAPAASEANPTESLPDAPRFDGAGQ